MNKPLISIIIPSYNEEDYIKKCINSLLNQSYEVIEIIVIDDGSTDKTFELLRNYKNKIKLLKQDHKGPGIARNIGAKKAKGRILVFVDSDMEFDKDYIMDLTKPIIKGDAFGTIHTVEKVANKENPWAICWGDRFTVDKNNEGFIYRAILKDKFFEYGPFDPNFGYADDQTIYFNSGKKAKGVKATCYHNNPSSLKEVYYQSKWIGASYRNKILKIPILNILFSLFFIFLISPFLIIKNTIKTILRNRRFKYIYYYPVFGLVKYFGMFVGMIKRIFLKKNIK